MYQILVHKTNKNFARGFRREKRYYQAPDFEQAFFKIVDLAYEVIKDDFDVEKERIMEELVSLFETNKTNYLPITISKKDTMKCVFTITSKAKKYFVQLKKYK